MVRIPGFHPGDPGSSPGIRIRFQPAVIAQLGERQTEDLKGPGSIPGHGTFFLPPKVEEEKVDGGESGLRSRCLIVANDT